MVHQAISTATSTNGQPSLPHPGTKGRTDAWQGAVLPIARYRFRALAHDQLLLPAYAGSLLRGQFGAALRRLACMTGQPSCQGCPLRATCPYTRIFEAPPPPEHRLQRFSAIPNAYVVEAPSPRPASAREVVPAGAELTFHMVLAGNAIADLALVIHAWRRALAHGLGRQRSRCELRDVEWIDADGDGHSVWLADAPRLQTHPAQIRVPTAIPATQLHLDFYTPLRLQHQGRPLRPAQLTPRALIAALARRAALVLEFHCGQGQWGEQVPAVAASAEHLDSQHTLQWYDWTRYSSRQRQEMTLGGVLGRWTLLGQESTIASVWPWLWLGQWLHAGKNATFGMGGYRLGSSATWA